MVCELYLNKAALLKRKLTTILHSSPDPGPLQCDLVALPIKEGGLFSHLLTPGYLWLSLAHGRWGQWQCPEALHASAHSPVLCLHHENSPWMIRVLCHRVDHPSQGHLRPPTSCLQIREPSRDEPVYPEQLNHSVSHGLTRHKNCCRKIVGVICSVAAPDWYMCRLFEILEV